MEGKIMGKNSYSRLRSVLESRNWVACLGGERGRNPVGVERRFARFPRVARRLATLGWRTQSLWDCLQGKENHKFVILVFTQKVGTEPIRRFTFHAPHTIALLPPSR